MSESIRRAAAAEVAKHRGLLRSGRGGRVLSALLLPLLWSAPPRGFGVLITTGRKTGKSRRKCVRVIRGDDRAYLAQSLICDTVHPIDYCECALHLRGVPSRAKIAELHRYWFDTGIPVAIDLKTTHP